MECPKTANLEAVNLETVNLEAVDLEPVTPEPIQDSTPKKTMGFIILRHVRNEETDQYWKLCYDTIRAFYKENPIMIIDDNSDSKYITSKQLEHTTVIHSEFPQRGELLPYLYYLKNPIADIVMILHDSMFITKCIDFSEVDCYKSLWDFKHTWDQPYVESCIIKVFDSQLLNSFHYTKELWEGCFGGASIITHDFLQFIHADFDLFKLTDIITCRHNRMSFERIIGCIMQLQYHKFKNRIEIGPEDKTNAFFGNIHKYCLWESITFRNKHEFMHLPIIKIWTGR